MKKVRLQAFFLAFGIFLATNSYCQRTFEKGYVISTNEDTLFGFIKHLNKDKNPSTITFRKELNSQDIMYNPTVIKKFRVLDEMYESAVVTIDDSPVKDNELTFSKEFHHRTDTVFLRILIEGEKSLFYYKDELWRPHFFIRKGEELERLIYKKYLVRVDGRRTIKTNKSFVGQLSLYFNSCPTIQPKLSKAQYNSRDLIDAFQSYYECTDTKIDFQQKKVKVVTEFGVTAGLTSTKIKFYGNEPEHYHLTQVEFPSSTNPSVGLFVNFGLPWNHGKWAIYNELLYNSYKTTGEYHEASSDNITIDKEITLAYSYVHFNNLLRFRYPVRNMFFYLTTGISNGFVVKETNSAVKTKRVYSKESVQHTYALKHTTKFEQGLIVGFGSQFRKYSFESRYEMGTGMSKSGSESISRKLHFLLGYRF